MDRIRAATVRERSGWTVSEPRPYQSRDRKGAVGMAIAYSW